MKQFYLGILFLGCCMTAMSQEGITQNGIIKALTDSTTIQKKKGVITYVRPEAGFNPYYRLYVGANYNIIYNSHKKSYKAKQTFGLNYSLTENSFSPYYSLTVPKAIDDWSFLFLAGYDQSRRMNFFGIGNETQRFNKEREFYRFRTQNQYASMSVDKFIGIRHHVNVSLLYDAIQIKNREDHYLSLKEGNLDPRLLQWQYYVSPQITYSYMRLSEQLVDKKSFDITTSLSYNENLNREDASFMRLTTDMKLYLPLSDPFSLLVHAGGATLVGNPDFYQLNTIGGSSSLRGYPRYRFYGNTSFYNQNELQWAPFIKTKFYKGHLGLLALYDQGRVWQPGESSGKIHSAYGGGIILKPLNKTIITATYAISNEDHRIDFRVGKTF